MNKREAAIISAHKRICVGDFDEVLKYITEILNREPSTAELATSGIWHNIEEKSREDFKSLNIE